MLPDDDLFLEDDIFPWLADESMADETFDPDPGDLDGDMESGLASAGWGTDEDYGDYGDFGEDW